MRELDLLTTPLVGIHLIEASAGTGKTYTITFLYLRLLLDEGLTVDQILVVTFTEAATAELKDRIRRNLAQAQAALRGAVSEDATLKEMLERITDRAAAAERLNQALLRFDEACIFTIHGFCQRMLGELAFAGGTLFDAELSADQDSLLMDLAADFYRRNVAGLPAPLCRHVCAKGCTPQGFSLLAGNLPLDAHVIPDQGRPAVEELLQAVARQKTGLSAIWQNSASDIRSILESDPGLNRQSYNRNIGRWCMEMQAFLQGADLRPFDKFEMFTADRLAVSLKRGFDPPRHVFFDECESYCRLADQLAVQLDELSVWLKRGFVEHLQAELPGRKEVKNILYFDDLLLQMRAALASESFVAAVRQRYGAALIDEFQDTDPVQYAIFSRIFNQRLYLIGDPKQAIYSFRGADIFTYLRAKAAVPEENRHTLKTNYRSAPAVVGALDTLFASAGNPFVFDGIPFEKVLAGRDDIVPPEGLAALNLWLLDAEGTKPLSREKAGPRIGGAVAGEILRLLDDGTLLPADIAVLVRTNTEAALIRDELAARMIPCVLDSTENIFAADEAREICRVLEAVAEPGTLPAVRGALLSRMIGWGLPAVERLQDDDELLDQVLARFYKLHEKWHKKGVVPMFALLLDEFGVRERLLQQAGGERSLTNVLQLLELLGTAEIEGHKGPSQLLKWLSGQLAGADEHRQEDVIRLESDADAVRIQTVHKSKGLEYEVVFCPFVWGGLRQDGNGPVKFYDDRLGARLLDLSPDEDHLALARREELAENMRLLYVAMTRARRCCYAVWGRISGFETAALAWLLHGWRCAEVNDLLSGKIKELDFALLEEDVQALSGRNPEISVSRLPSIRTGYYRPPSGQGVALQCRSFSRRIENSRRLTSFSAMVSGSAHAADYDAMLGREQRASQAGSAAKDIFAFPRGARPGTMLHRIFEDLDYTAGPDHIRAVCAQTLKLYGYASDWADTLSAMVANVLQAELAEGMRLADVTPAARINELEFYFPLRSFTAANLRQIYAAMPDSLMPAELEFGTISGYVHGFVDLIFRANGRYYIIDWKSNHLGNSPDDYNADGLAGAMREHHYHLQYLLYSVALDRYLKNRIADYDFGRHFGGVCYVFLRGVRPDRPDLGIYRAGVDRALLDKAAGLLLPEDVL